jgi:hypothetical protein
LIKTGQSHHDHPGKKHPEISNQPTQHHPSPSSLWFGRLFEMGVDDIFLAESYRKDPRCGTFS